MKTIAINKKIVFVVIIASILLFQPSSTLADDETVVPNDTTTSSTIDTVVIVPQTDVSSTAATVQDTTPSSTEETPTPETPTVPTPAAPKTITVRIEGPDATFIDESIEVPETCSVIASNETVSTTFTGYKAICALEALQDAGQITFENTHWSFGFSLDQINAIANAPDWSATWIVRQNNATAMVGIGDLTVNDNDALLLSYGGWPMNPLFLTTPTTTVMLGDTVTLMAKMADENGTISTPITDITLHIGDDVTSTSSGTYSFTLTTTTSPLMIWADAPQMTRSKKLLLTVNALVDTTTTPSDSTPPQSSNTSGGGSSGGNTTPTPNTTSFNTNAALVFLGNNQASDGSFGNAFYTDWAAIAFGTADTGDTHRSALRQYLLTNPTPGSLLTDNERRAMALEALGVNPYSGTNTNYIQSILDTYHEHQFGDANLFNDDIFAIFPLLSAGIAPTDSRIVDAVHFIVAAQSSNGSWGSVDLTAAAIQALSMAKHIDGVTDAINRGRAYLASQEFADGSFGHDPIATAWALQAIAALGESPNNWSINAHTPLDFLASVQATDGGITTNPNDTNTRTWGTSYAIPGATLRPWSTILTSFPAPTNNTATQNTEGSAGVAPILISVPTSTTPIAPTTTIEIVPTTTIQVSTTLAISPTLSNEETTSTTEIATTVTTQTPKILVRRSSTINTPPADTVPAPTLPPTTLTVGDVSPDPVQTVAKKVFAGAATLTASLSLFLGWRLLVALL